MREFAERLLHGASLDDKLYDPGPVALRDDARGLPWQGRAEPGREGTLAMSAHAEPFVGDAALADPRSRGRALHFFANHELLALELMALALLRFVDAPPAFRRGLVTTIRDEQRHLGLYLARMRALGVELGEVPLGGFFWRTVAELDDPAAFVAHMSLTFEQANLDYALHYEQVFRALGDERSAALMAEVYADEITHVGLGLHWFQRWRPGPLWEAHGEALVAPVTLRRARGRGFDRRGRERAGFPADYVEAIANLPSARGRRPVVHLFEPTMELELADPGSFNPTAATRARARDLEGLPAFYAAPDDLVLVREAPRAEFLASLRAGGVVLPEFVVGSLDGAQIDVPGLDDIARVEPWGWTPRLAKRLLKLRARARHARVPEQGWTPTISSKTRAVGLLARLLSQAQEAGEGARLSEPATLGRVVREVAELDAVFAELRGRGFETLVCKAPYGVSGRGLMRVIPGPIPATQRAWFERVLGKQGALIVEPWLERLCDLSLRLRIDSPGRAEIESVGRELIDARGQFRGAVIGRASAGLPSALARFFHGEGRDPKWMARSWRRVAEAVAQELEPTGYVGYVGVDAFIHAAADGSGSPRLRPVVELNTRVHMSHVAQELGKLLARRSVGLWRFVPAAQLHKLPPPPQMSAQGIVHGLLATNDPQRAELVVGLLAVAASLPEAESLLAQATIP